MTFKKTRLHLLLIFFIALFIQLTCFYICFLREVIFPDDLTLLVTETLNLYSVHLAIILSTLFLDMSKNSIVDKNLYIVCISIVVFWNLLLFVRVLIFLTSKHDDPVDLLRYLNNVSASSSFLVAGILAFFFSKNAQS
jgi:hypothetical protein